MKYAYYPGCSATGTSSDYEVSTQAVCRALGITLAELPDWNCCGSTPAHATSTELSAALCVRNLNIAAEQGAQAVLTPCPSCLSNLRHAAHRMEDARFRTRVDELLDAPSASHFPPVTSVMQALVEGFGVDVIGQRAARKLTGLRLAPYYGCLMSRPAEIMRFGDPENPTMMEALLTACGAEVLDFPLKTTCCGASFGIPERAMTATLCGEILRVAHNMGADALVVACPLCQMNLDLRQKQAAKAVGLSFNMPVVYFTQLLGLAFGENPAALGFNKLCVSPTPMLHKWETARATAQAAQAPKKTATKAAVQKTEEAAS